MSADHNGAVVIVDYGMGNIGSVVNAFDMLGERCVVSQEPAALRRARGIVLPGVGAFAAAMANIRALGAVAYQRGEAAGSSMILYIAEPQS